MLASGKTDYHCTVKEALLIQELQPALNGNVGGSVRGPVRVSKRVCSGSVGGGGSVEGQKGVSKGLAWCQLTRFSVLLKPQKTW